MPPDTVGAVRRRLGEVLDGFDSRLNFIAARGFDLSRVAFSAGFARNLDYYTGFVFEVDGAFVSDGRVPADGVVEAFDVIEHIGSGFVT